MEDIKCPVLLCGANDKNMMYFQSDQRKEQQESSTANVPSLQQGWNQQEKLCDVPHPV